TVRHLQPDAATQRPSGLTARVMMNRSSLGRFSISVSSIASNRNTPDSAPLMAMTDGSPLENMRLPLSSVGAGDGMTDRGSPNSNPLLVCTSGQADTPSSLQYVKRRSPSG